jgi:hypothetical protein
MASSVSSPSTCYLVPSCPRSRLPDFFRGGKSPTCYLFILFEPISTTGDTSSDGVKRLEKEKKARKVR